MKSEFNDYKELSVFIDKLYDDGKYDELVEKLEAAYVQFPEHEYDLRTDNLYYCRSFKNYDKCIEILKEDMENGHFYGLRWSSWDPLREMPQWNEIEKNNEKNRAIAASNSKMEYKVFTPEGYNENNKYPLMIILHGDGFGCNIKNFSSQWKPDSFTGKGFIVVYLQSSYPECSCGFGWTFDYDQSRKDILEGYEKVCESYSVDLNNIHLGGFSGGAMASLNMMMNNTIPAKSIIALCPGEADDVNESNMEKAAARGVKLVLLEGENSDNETFHKNLIKSAEKFNLPAAYMINKNIDHDLPENWNEILVDVIDFLDK